MQGSAGGEDILILQQQTGCQESGSGPGTALTSDVASGKSTFWASVSSSGERDELDDNWGEETHTQITTYYHVRWWSVLDIPKFLLSLWLCVPITIHPGLC